MIKKIWYMYVELSFIIMIIVICREIMLPFVLGIFSTHNHVALLSDFGSPGMPTRHFFKRWEFIDGILFILGTPFYYQYLKIINKKMARYFIILVSIYGIGDCTFTALFDYSGSYFANWHSMLHALGSIVGCGALFIANILLILLLMYDGKSNVAKFFCKTQLLSILACILCLLFENFPLLGSTLQMIGLDGLYLPLLVLGIYNIKILVVKTFFFK